MQCDFLEKTVQGAQTLMVCAPSVSWVVYATPIILVISSAIAIYGVVQARETARKKATLDLIEKVESSQHYRDMHGTFSYYRRQGLMENLNNPTEAEDNKKRQSILDYLNHYELVSIGIENDILDPDIYKEWMLGPFIRDWNAASNFIQRERWKFEKDKAQWVYHDSLFSNYQKVARSWSEDAVLLESDGNKPTKAEGPGDEPLPHSSTDDSQ